MNECRRIELPKVEGHFCFACGTANPIGLNLNFYRRDDAICTDVTLGKYHVGWENIAHGGIISTLLDEVMSWTIIYLKRIFLVTRRMEIKYMKPVLIDVPLIARGRLIENVRRPFTGARAEILDEHGNVLARSSGRFAPPPEEESPSEKEGMKTQLSRLFDRFPSGP